ncbi:Aldo/keto reductase [Trichormus variabilis ATCC 29413]|uniref:Aldo/keto reductase n=2 Tax=Anabaena variabilis TaxID=264691 RepID=Q3MGX6_TRIV2|nr:MULTISPECIES: aldo/keto reductase [Nostocaceae]ABA19760.1 Aldo/keto reductase [Trichormus variabilis ATCC 29413]MBC1214752.1 aldo/keto reductase [Trichormus variabilis ARAD]MBC1254492.1 aldo/keto reductase [Trichormus variabilis V5]MBC1267034.1 aldo/keto reductase [Trichormus variabilis FSR]MBC1303520.1 aldo/keto reductase [Trichormus variabilis N2B]
METTQLGKTGVFVSAIGLGGMPMSIYNRPPESDSIQVIHRALDLGITFIDTADSYCKDESDKHHNERLIHKALSSYPGDTSQVVVATKGGLMRPNESWTRNGNPEHLRQTIRVSFEALGGEKPIDVWQYHFPDPEYTIAESLVPVKEAVEAGLIRFVGVSNFSVEQIKQARDVVDIVSVQNQYSPWERQPEKDGVLQYCEQEKLTFLPWSPFGGRRRHQDLQDIPAIAQLAKAKGVSVYSIVLAWLRAKSPTILPIPGASKISSIEDSVSAVNVKLTNEEVQKI